MFKNSDNHEGGRCIVNEPRRRIIYEYAGIVRRFEKIKETVKTRYCRWKLNLLT